MLLYTRRSVLAGCAAMLAPLLGGCTRERTADYYAAFGSDAKSNTGPSRFQARTSPRRRGTRAKPAA